ncbi:MAG: rhodanese-like domain-containing protein [Saprospiraceae bacterium]|jgi:phage shock protein E|nr:rhodanese-like domain-containing protein [Saprospiraceae bacterium]
MFNFLKSLFSPAPSVDLSEVIARKPFLVDVRTPGEFASGHPKGSVNIPLDKVAANLSKFKGKKDIVVFCRSGNRSSQAKSILESHGVSNVTDAGPWQNVAGYTG